MVNKILSSGSFLVTSIRLSLDYVRKKSVYSRSCRHFSDLYRISPFLYRSARLTIRNIVNRRCWVRRQVPDTPDKRCARSAENFFWARVGNYLKISHHVAVARRGVFVIAVSSCWYIVAEGLPDPTYPTSFSDSIHLTIHLGSK